MTEQPVRVVFHLHQSWDLVSVFCCAVEHQAIQAGFESEAGADLARAAGDVCRETISQLGGDAGSVDVTLDTFPNRMEVAIHCRGSAGLAIGPGAVAGAGEASPRSSADATRDELLSRVDRVFYNAEEGVARTTLVKFLPVRK